MKKIALALIMVLAMVTLAVGASAADPVISIDFANGAGDVELVDADIVADPTRGNVLQVYGNGAGSNGQSYGLLETSIFENTDWSDGCTISMWVKTDVASSTLSGTAPLYSFDIANVGYISVVTSLESAINTDGNDTSLGITPRCWNDPTFGNNKTEEGVWQMITVVYADDSMHIYVDGESYSDPVVNNCTMDDLLFQMEFVYSLRLGSWLCSWWNQGDYEGCIDDVLVYNTALSSDDVADLYSSTKITQTVFEEAPALEDLYDGSYVAPIKVIDFDENTEEIELVNASIDTTDRNGKAIKINGTGDGTTGTSYGLWTTDFFKDTDWSNGMTISLWVKADGTESLRRGAPMYSMDLCGQGFIALVSSEQSAINTDGNEDYGIVRCWNDPNDVGGAANLKNEWVNYVVVYGDADNTRMAIYKNGECITNPAVNTGTVADLEAEMNLVYSLRLGSWICAWWNNGDFEGYIDDITIYDKALNPLQVLNTYNGVYDNAETAVEETPVVEEVVEETVVVEAPVETVVEETVVETPAETAPVTTAPQTFDVAVIAAVAAVISGAGYAVAKKKNH